MSIGDDSTSIHDALYQRLDDMRRERDSARAKVERLRADLAYERQLHLDAKVEVERWRKSGVAMATEVERLRALLREVAGSGVQLPAEPPGLPYTTVQIDGELWERLRKEFGQ